jgi:ABC-type polysaccharide/polyol phosphate transport system ATPase subunit
VTAVEIRNVSKSYFLSGSQTARLRRILFSGGAGFSGSTGSEDTIQALRDVSFTVARGEAFGIIGANGSGKSTLLQIVAGILRPTSGSVRVDGRLSALLELGSGFSPEFTGRENVYLNASILGLSRAEIDARFEAIERFAGIGDFVGQPVRTYSTGMVLRLAFAVAAHVDPEILIVDEALAVGDIAFRQRCMLRIHELRARGATILFVSHETADVKALCERCLWLHKGAIREIGEADDVVAKYLTATLQKEIADAPARAALPPEQPAPPGSAAGHRYGDGRVTISGAALFSASGDPVRACLPRDRIFLRFTFRVNGPVPEPIAGFLVRNAKGENIFGTNTARENYPLPRMETGDCYSVEFHWTAPELKPGAYSISVAVSDGNIEDFRVCDYVEDAIPVQVIAGGAPWAGYFHLECAAIAIHRHGNG